MKTCKVCGGAIADLGEVTGWAGKWCHCIPTHKESIGSGTPYDLESVEDYMKRRKNFNKEGVDSTLEERGKRYGKFIGHAAIAQTLKSTMKSTAAWNKLHSDQKEALEMIQHKIARILNGDPDYADSWHDIAGYATLVENRLNGKVV